MANKATRHRLFIDFKSRDDLESFVNNLVTSEALDAQTDILVLRAADALDESGTEKYGRVKRYVIRRGYWETKHPGVVASYGASKER